MNVVGANHIAALVKRLSIVAGLTQDGAEAIRRLPMNVRHVSAQTYVVRDGEASSQCCVIIEGFAFRSKTTSNGRRQILSIHIAGDLPDLQSLHLPLMDHDLVALTDCTMGFIPHNALRALNRQRPQIGEMLWRESLVDSSLFRDALVNLGQRPALARLAHLLLELRKRLEIVGHVQNGQFQLPLTQEELADTLGLSGVHVNRVLRQLRELNLVEMHRHTVRIPDLRRLEELADFDPSYLHLEPAVI
jgi:CRP-like cAMP-binding protein